MIALKLVPGKGLDSGYSSATTGRGWKVGEVREVSPEVAKYLASTFPDAFVEHSEPQAEQRAPVPVQVERKGETTKAVEKAPEPKPVRKG